MYNQQQRIAERQAWFTKIHTAAENNNTNEWLQLQIDYLKWDGIMSQSRFDMVKMLELILQKLPMI